MINKYSNGIGDNFSKCWISFPTNKALREKCQADFQQGKGDATELERIRLQNEALALQNAGKNTGMSTSQIALLGGGGILVLTIMAVVIKKYAK